MAPPAPIFKVQRCEPELITPSKPTPHEFKPLSDIDDQEGLRFHIPVIQIYRHDPSVEGKDPVQVIRNAIAKALVFYYPFAGRIREGPNRKLIMDCNGEGVLFIEADANVSLDQSGDALQPPCPFLDELLFDVPGSSRILNCPVILIQVTRFKCGGFTFAIRFNHTMSDGPGLAQFLSAIAEMARGRQSPSIFPVWERHVLDARNPPRVTCIHREYDHIENGQGIPFPLDDIVHRAIFIGPSALSTLRSRYIPPHLSRCTDVEILTACLWKCRTIALQPDAGQEMRMILLNNARKFNPPLLPEGYYGNGFVLSTAVATAGEISKSPIGYGLELIRKAKMEFDREYIKSVADLLVIKGRPHFTAEGTYVVSDVRHARFKEVDFGWGNAIYGGPAKAIPIAASFYVPFESKKGENGIVIPICLPAQAMERFVKELKNLLDDNTVIDVNRSSRIISAL
ncbi:benzyl alcohol O-benzoyltransferase isoform X2 [Jatropha curcas]|uniref:benzyl alcohol O-benzoyltransferase isoform X2 n=1 Tax=Jatropha curcas TaxID=180498 RepID=UPI00189382B0|nr:benzyl alcohol O-benzoyltransferase isoform X2 [Jatropha curcas]